MAVGAAFFSSLTLAVGLAAGWLHLARRDGRPLPTLAAIGLFHAITSGLSPFLIAGASAPDDLLVRVVTYGTGTAALLFAGVALMLAAAWASHEVLSRRVPSPFGVGGQDDNTARLLSWGLLGLHIVFYAVPPLSAIPSLGQFAKMAGFVGFGTLVLMGCLGRAPRWELWLVLGALLPARLVLGYMTSAVGEAAYLGGFLLFLLFHLRPRTTLVGLAVIMALAAASYKPLHIYRVVPLYLGLDSPTPAQRLEILVNVLRDSAYYGFDPTKSDFDIGRRIAHAEVMNTVQAITPDPVPYWEGKTYRTLLSNLIPRALWKDKPQETQGNEFGRRYGFIKDDNRETSMNLPWLVEAFANFGSAGVLVIPILLGAIIGLGEAAFNRRGLDPWQLSAGATLLLPFINQDSNLSLSIGNVPTMLVALAVYFRCGFLLSKRLRLA